MKRYRSKLLLALVSLLLATSATAQKKYDTGATDTEIKIGQTMPYSGPASAYGTIGKTEVAYFEKINAEGGINGRKIRLLSVDDGYSPPKTVEMVRKLVEQDEVLFIFNSLGTPSNIAIQKYLNGRKVPQLFVATGATRWGDPKDYPWTMGWQPNYQTEGRIYAKDILANHGNKRLGVLYQNDDYGKDMLKGLKDGLGARASMIVAEATYEVSDPTVDSQLVTLKAANVDVLVNITIPKFAALSIRKVYDMGWKPVHYLNNISASVGSVLTPAGVEKAVGIVTVAYLKDPNDAQWVNDPALKEYFAFMARWAPDAKAIDANNVYGYTVAQTLAYVLKACGDDLTRANIMKQAANIKDLQLPLALPGVKINTSPTDFYPIESLQLQKFDGKQWVLFGKVIE